MSLGAVTGTERRAARAAGLLVAAAFAARLLLLAWSWPARPALVVNPDTPTYVRPALALLRAGAFSPSPERAPEPELNRTPGYPAIVAAAYGVFGERPVVLGVLSALFSSGAIALLVLLARRVVPPGAALLPALLLALDPGSFRYGIAALTEPPFTFLLLLGLLLALRAADAPRGLPLAAAAGLTLAAATLVRPITLYFLPASLVLLPAALAGWRRPAKLAAYALPAVLLCGGWSLRNELRAGTPSFTLNQSVELHMIRGAYVEALAEGSSVADVRERIGWPEYLWRFGYVASEAEAFGATPYAEAFPRTSRLSLPELARLYAERGRATLAAHPAETARMTLHGLAFLLLSPPFTNAWYHAGLLVPDAELLRAYFFPKPLEVLDWLRRHHPVAWALSVASVPVLLALALLALRGAILSLRSREALVLAAALAYLVLVSAGPSAIDDRYRVPLMPLLCLFAVRGALGQRAAKT